MKKRDYKTVFQHKEGEGSKDGGDAESNNGAAGDDMSHTMRFSRKALVGDIPIRQNAYLEIYGLEKNPVGVDLGSEEINIGRSPECTIQLPLNNVSRIHARIYCRNEEYYVEDLESTNGTYLNNIRIVKCVLRNNDQIEIGEAKLVFIEDRKRER